MSLHVAWCMPQSFCSKNRCCLMNNKMAVKFLAIFDFWMKFVYLFCVSMLHSASHQVSIQEKICVSKKLFEKNPGRLFSAWPSLVSELYERSISKSRFGLTHPIKFCPWGHMVSGKLLFEEYQDGYFVDGVVIFDIWIELFKLFWVSMLPDASHQVSAWDNIWVGRCCLKNIKMSV